MTNEQNTTKFLGFSEPNYTQIPNIIIDKIMPFLTGNEFKVLTYIARRTLGFHKVQDSISLSQLVSGIKRNGRVVNYGTRLSKATVARCLNSLEKKGYIVRVRRSNEARGDLPTGYSLRFRREKLPVSQNETPSTDEQSDTVSQNETGGVSELNTEVSHFETHKRNRLQNKQQQKRASDVVVDLLLSEGLAKGFVNQIASQFDEAYVRQKLAYLRYLQKEQPAQVKNPRGWLRKALEEDYGPPDRFVSPEEQKKRLKKRQQQQQAQYKSSQIEIDEVSQKVATSLQKLKETYQVNQEDEAQSQQLVELVKSQKVSSLLLSSVWFLKVDVERGEVVTAVANKFVKTKMKAPHIMQILHSSLQKLTGKKGWQFSWITLK